MAKVRPDCLDDLAGKSDRMEIRCRACGHCAVYLIRDIIGYFRHRNWSRLFSHAAVRFRCRTCGTKDAAFGVAPRPWTLPAIPKPEPLVHPDDKPRGSGRAG
jgi:ribosomal protein S27E